MKIRSTLAMVGVGLATGCSGPAPVRPQSLTELVVEDPSFTFSTSAVAGVAVTAAPEAPAPIELRLPNGGLVLQGGFRESTRLDLRLPLSTPHLVRAVGAGETEIVEIDGAATK